MDQETFPVGPGITAVDTRMAGRPRATSAYLVAGERPALVETGPATSAEAVRRGLASLGLGPDDLAHILVTHIHLDHAGGAGTLARAFPGATVWVHQRGAPHLANPARLVASTARVYGEERVRELFGETEPVPAERLRAAGEGDVIDLGSRVLDVMETPGHASHHLCFQDRETGAVFTGDAVGVHLPDVGVLRPATPPPEFQVEAAVESIERVRRRARGALLLSHFGPTPDVDRACELAVERVRAWSEVVRRALETTDDLDRITDLLEAEWERECRQDGGDPARHREYDVLFSARANAAGLVRYWRQRREGEGVVTGTGGGVPEGGAAAGPTGGAPDPGRPG